jgi:hypothetical protein
MHPKLLGCYRNAPGGTFFLVVVRAAISALTVAISALYFTKYNTADRASLKFAHGVLGLLSLFISCLNFITTHLFRALISSRLKQLDEMISVRALIMLE